ncbi:MAG: leucine-rich repeat protein [Kiritimatiellae bacterium]|nr:leucine-rich repeat protein [Kiritimatiellia bacterium]
MKTAKTLAGNPLTWFLGRHVSSETAQSRAPLPRRVRHIACSVAAAAALSLFADTWTDGAGVEWMYSVSGGQAEICGPGDSLTPAIPATTKGVIEIPETLGGCPVTRIDDYAFTGCAELTGAVIPESVVSIGHEAFFGCTSLEEIAIPDSVETIGDAAFCDCGALARIKLPQAGVDDFPWAFTPDVPGMVIELSDSVVNIPDSKFQGVSMVDVLISEGVTNIGAQAFGNCWALKRVAIPASVEKIGYGAFMACDSLEEIVVDEGNAFYGTLDGNLVRKADNTLMAVPGNITSLTIPPDVKAIGWWAALGCRSLERVTIHGGVSVVGKNAFAECKALSTVTISEGVESIGAGAFYDCPALKSVRLPASLKQLDDYAFGKCKNLKLVVMPRIECGELVFKGSNSGLEIRYLDEEAPASHKLTAKANGSKYGTVSGGGEYEPGTKVTLKAKAKNGYVFSGWYSDKACTVALNPKGYDNRKPAVKIAMPAKKTTVYAKFITLADDKKALKFTAKTKKLAKTAAKAKVKKSFTLKLGIKSASYPTVTAKGLPAGLSIDKTTGVITGKAKKAGTYTVKVKVKDYAGNVISQKVKIKVQ